MKQLVLLVILFCELTLTAATVQPGLKYSQYPNTPTFHPSDLMLMATTNTSPPTNKNMKMGDLALQIVNSNKVVVLDGTNTLVVNTFTNGTNFYAVNSTADAASGVGVGLAPGTTTIVVDGSLNTRTNALIGDSSIIFSNLTTGQPVRGWFFSSNGAWNITVPQANDSNTVSRGIEQPFTNNWVWVDATKLSDGQTNFSSRAPPFTIGPGTNTVFDTNLATRHISVSAAGASGGGGDQVWTNDSGVIKTLAYGTNVQFSPGVANGATAIAHSLDTTNLLTDSSATLLSVRNKGTNRFKVFSDGETWIGKDLENWFSPAGGYRLAVGRSLETDPGAQSVYFGSFHPTSGLDWGFGLDSDTNLVQFTLTAGAVIPTRLLPTIADGVTPYLFNTTLAHTTGNLAEFGNVSLNHFAVVATNGIVTPRISAYGATSQPWQFGSVVGDFAQVTINGVLVNLATNSGGSGVPSGYQTNQFTTNVAGSPVLGAIWFNGTNGIAPPMTNGARVGVEWTPVQRSLRIGELGNNGVGPDPKDSTTITSNYWHATNIGFGSIAMGSNVMAKGPYSTILNGIYNITHSNAVASSILGGSNNIVYTNATFSTIVGGTLNRIQAGSDFGVIGGGDQNDIIGSDSATIGGGSSCDINIGSQNATIGGGSVNMITLSPFGTVSGGRNNSLDNSTDATIAGGQLNEIGTGGGPAAHAFIGGGNGNSIYLIGNFSVIAGGSDNDIGQNPTGGSTHGFIGGGAGHRINAGSDYSTIVGGKQNATSGSFPDYIQILGGTSNNVSATMGTAIGNYVTNETVNSVEIGHANLRKARVDVNGLKLFAWTNTTASVGGTLVVSNAPIASAGASETNLIAYTVPAHVLTNNNDRLTFRASGRFAATANAKQIKVVYGSETILDTGSQIVNSGAWTIEGEIIRIGNTSQSVNAEFHGAGVTLFNTASSLDLAQTNNISTVLKLTGTAAGDGDITNRTLVITWHPSP